MRKFDIKQKKSLASALPPLAARPLARPNVTRMSSHEQLYKSRKVTLIEALDRVIDKGAYVDGELVLRVADIDLVFIGLRLLVTSVSNAERLKAGERMGKLPSSKARDLFEIQKLEQQLREIDAHIPRVIDAGNPEKAEQGIAKLVLTIIELIRQLLEREAVRRVDVGTLTDTEVEKLGLTFKALERKIQEMKTVFGIKEELNLELGPLGNLL